MIVMAFAAVWLACAALSYPMLIWVDRRDGWVDKDLAVLFSVAFGPISLIGALFMVWVELHLDRRDSSLTDR